MNQSKVLKQYINGNYSVRLFEDGTKIRFTNDDEFKPIFPESIDLKITNRCDLRCLMCHEESTPTGKNADLSHPFFDSLKEGCELAIGGGNPLEHPDLKSFLIRMKNKGVICNITVHQMHLIRFKDFIEELINEKLIYGIGISVNKDFFIDEVITFCKSYPNSVIHIIAGVIDIKVLEKLYDNDLKLLILGYKNIGRGLSYFSKNVEDKINYFEKNILNISKRFKIVSFDNLSIIQLKMKQKVYNYETLYMGDDGEFTMYIDLVKKEYSISSCSKVRFKIDGDIISMFNKIRQANIKYHIVYYLLYMNKKETLIATLKEDNDYTFKFDEKNKKWEFVGKFDNLINSMYKLDELTKSEAIMLSFGEFVSDKYDEMFNFNIEKE